MTTRIFASLVAAVMAVTLSPILSIPSAHAEDVGVVRNSDSSSKQHGISVHQHDAGEAIAYYQANGVNDTQAVLLYENLSKGILPESMTNPDNPTSFTRDFRDGQVVEKKTYSDGSFDEISYPVSLSGFPTADTSVTECVHSRRGKEDIWKDCLVRHSNLVGAMEFRFDYSTWNDEEQSMITLTAIGEVGWTFSEQLSLKRISRSHILLM
ncbi:hypothetical protein [Mobiluncus mulieris]|uniref:Uncharacterized protein n=1 Tax=Mobiluncus mulieris TaxID=2052 RepID=A0ABD4TY11_9ACTO|nr:hypothetical protein [Mobiluncus mulieris]MCU9969771.1 hypothetical protein [Mobiluncus mulieris]